MSDPGRVRERVGPPPAGRFPIVVSASRRIDLPACFPDELAAKILEIGTERIHTLVLWTKDPRPALAHPLLRPLLDRLESIHLHLTVTGLGGTPLEPGVPTWRDVLDSIPLLLKLPGLRPDGICLRYDPLVSVTGPGGRRLSNLDRDLFKAVTEAASDHGVGRLRTSIMTVYPKVIKRLETAGFRAAADLQEEGRGFIEKTMLPRCRRLGLPLFTCVNPDRGDPGCIDGRLLSGLHPRGLPCSLARDGSQRQGCHCTKSLDIGRYLSCPHGCLYCYGNPRPAGKGGAP